MALIKCKECGNKVSKNATSCPKCGSPVKEKTSTTSWIALLALILLAGSYLGTENEPPPSGSETASKPKIYPTEKMIRVGYTSYKVLKSWFSNRLSDNQYLNKPPDASYLFVKLTVRNDDDESRAIPPFKLVDSQGKEYETTSKSLPVAENISALDSLNPGVSKEGVIVFDVPRGRNYKLRVSGGYWSDDEALFKLNSKDN